MNEMPNQFFSYTTKEKTKFSTFFFSSFQNLFPNPTCPNASTIRKLASLYSRY